MSGMYLPSSAFLRALAEDEVPLQKGKMRSSDLKRLIALTSDKDKTNRDWAVLLLSQLAADGQSIREALSKAAEDPAPEIRAEAILGLVQRGGREYLPLVLRELDEEQVFAPIFEAAQMLADGALLPALTPFLCRSGDSYLDDLARDAYSACARGRISRGATDSPPDAGTSIGQQLGRRNAKGHE